jgi:hypothetical protein
MVDTTVSDVFPFYYILISFYHPFSGFEVDLIEYAHIFRQYIQKS